MACELIYCAAKYKVTRRVKSTCSTTCGRGVKTITATITCTGKDCKKASRTKKFRVRCKNDPCPGKMPREYVFLVVYVFEHLLLLIAEASLDRLGATLVGYCRRSLSKHVEKHYLGKLCRISCGVLFPYNSVWLLYLSLLPLYRFQVLTTSTSFLYSVSISCTSIHKMIWSDKQWRPDLPQFAALSFLAFPGQSQDDYETITST